MNLRNDAVALDRDDPLAPLRELFSLHDGTLYFDGNSLGVPPRAAAARGAAVIAEEWERGLIRSWNTAGWFALPRRLGNKLAPLIGGADDEVVITDTISSNLFKVLSAALRVATPLSRATKMSSLTWRRDVISKSRAPDLSARGP